MCVMIHGLCGGGGEGSVMSLLDVVCPGQPLSDQAPSRNAPATAARTDVIKTNYHENN